MAAPPFDAFCPRNDQVALWAPGRGGAEDDMSGLYPPNTLLRHNGTHTIIRSVCAGHDFPIHDGEGVSLWFSGQRLLTDGTSENSYSTHLGE
jgi:hypothetical protein